MRCRCGKKLKEELTIIDPLTGQYMEYCFECSRAADDAYNDVVEDELPISYKDMDIPPEEMGSISNDLKDLT